MTSSLVIFINDLFLMNLDRSDRVWIVNFLYVSERLVSVFMAKIYSAISTAFPDETF